MGAKSNLVFLLKAKFGKINILQFEQKSLKDFSQPFYDGFIFRRLNFIWIIYWDVCLCCKYLRLNNAVIYCWKAYTVFIFV